MRALILLLFFAAIFLTACKTQQVAANNYLNNVTDTLIRDSSMLSTPVIRKNDLLGIRVYSRALGTSVEREVEAPYNLTAGEGSAGFLVDGNGNIEYPRLGLIHVEGMTREALAALIKSRLEGELTQPSVIVRFLNFRITVLGEVGQPSTVTVPNENITIIEALGLVGDVTQFGRRDNVKVVREVNGQRQIGTIDLTKATMFESPYFKLQQNDYIFVDQTSRRIRQESKSDTVQEIGIATSIITTIALILNFIIRR